MPLTLSSKERWMSRFHAFEAQNAVMQLRPVGLRKYWGLRNLPYRTGDELIIQIRTVSTHYEEGLVTDFRAWRLVIVSPANIEGARSGYVTRHKDLGVPITFGRLSFSGEYRIDLIVSNIISTGKTGADAVEFQEFERDEGVAVVQVQPDYLLWAVAWGLVLVVIGGILGKLLEKLPF